MSVSARIARTATLVGAASGLAAAMLAMSASWQHNPQAEIHDAQGVDWGYWLFISSTWFLPVAAVTGLITAALLLVLRAVRR